MPHDSLTLTIRLPDDSVRRVKADLEVLRLAAERSPEVRDRLQGLIDSGAQLLRFHTEGGAAVRAGELWVDLELADGLRDVLAAVRAGDR